MIGYDNDKFFHGDNLLTNIGNQVITRIAPGLVAPWSRAKGPAYLGEAYTDISKHGVYGQGGIQSIMSRVRQSRNFQRRQLARTLRKRFGNRLGPRSGATETLAANMAYGGAGGEDTGTEAQLMAENMRSKTQGLSGIMSVIEFLQSRYNQQQTTDAGKPGVVDYAGSLVNIANSVKSLFA